MPFDKRENVLYTFHNFIQRSKKHTIDVTYANNFYCFVGTKTNYTDTVDSEYKIVIELEGIQMDSLFEKFWNSFHRKSHKHLQCKFIDLKSLYLNNISPNSFVVVCNTKEF